MLPEIIKKIYVINLKSCIDRKKHIIEEFKNIGVQNYDFFDAIEKNSNEVIEKMKSGYVKKFPPCFRCQNNLCNCDNNVLINSQVGNWCSFIKIMNEIKEKEYEPEDMIMICEDDLKFKDNSITNFNLMINLLNFDKYNIKLNKPILIRVEDREKNREFLSTQELKMVKKKSMSNACFIINKLFAETFIKNLPKINTTSDIFIHYVLPKRDKSIQHFTIIPSLVYQLSDHKDAVFTSEIHPKGINEEDRIRKSNHIKKIIYKKFLCIGHPRCGTTTISAYFSQMGYDVKHQNMGKDGVSSWMLAVNSNGYPWGNIQTRKKYYFENIIHIIRNPFDAIPSIILENKYSPGNKSYNFRKFHINKETKNELPKSSLLQESQLTVLEELELAIKTFLYWNKICDNQRPNVVCKIEDIKPIEKFNKNNIKLNTIKKNCNKLYNGKSYKKPVISNDIYNKIDDSLKKELIKFCNRHKYENNIIKI